MEVRLIFRKKNPAFFSIETVFERILSALGPVPARFKKIILPKYGLSLVNLFFLNSHKEGSNTIYHVTGDVHYTVMLLPPPRTILTIHDCVFLEQNKGWRRWLLKKIFLDFPVQRVRYLTAISEKTKRDIVRYTGCAPEKITVIQNPILPDLYYKERTFNCAEPLLLFIGVTPNKNLFRIAKALKGISCSVLVIGRMSEEQVAVLKKNAIRYSTKHELSDLEMADQYAEADIVIFPSLYEGFGLPIIEGFKAGRVVVTSNRSPMKDVSQGAACLVDPEDVQSIREGVLKVKDDKLYREELIRKGFEVVKQFEPEVIAQQYYQLYEKVYKESCAE